MHETIPFRSVRRISTIENSAKLSGYLHYCCANKIVCVSSAQTLGDLQGLAGCNQANLTVMGGGSLSCTPLCFSVGLYDLYKRSLLIEELGLWDANNDNRHTQNLFERMGRMEAEL